MADNLLDKASILLTPTAYNDGSMLSVKPENGDGDFTFSRGSAATRVNAQGLVENVQIISSELVSNGDFSQGGQDWDLGTDVIVGDGFVKMDDSAALQGVQQTGVVTNGSLCRVTFTVQNYINGIVNLRHPLNENVSANGTYTFTGNANDTKLLIRGNDTTNDFEVTNISVKEVTDDTDLPRIDYTDGCGSWLLEPQSTNLILNSENLSDSSWQKSNSTIVSNSTISPSGYLNSDLLQENSSNSTHYCREILTVTSGVEYTLSFFAKKKDYDYIQYSRTVDGSSYANFNIANGTLGNNSGGDILNHQIEDYGNGWYRCIANITTSSTSTGLGITLLQSDVTSRYESYLGDGTSGTYIWGIQLEQQSSATSYIPTEGATSTRLQDIANNSGNSTLINSTEGVLYAEIAALADDGSTRVIQLSDGTNSNRIFIGYWTGSNNIRFALTSGGVIQTFQGSTSYDILNLNKIAFKFKENDFALWINGVEAVTDTSGITFPIGTLSQLDFDSNLSAYFYGKAKAVAVFKEALTDAQLQSLTTI